MYRLGSARLASTKQLAVVSTATAKLSTCTSDYKINITRCTNLPVAQRTNVITRRETMRILCLMFRRSEVRHSVISTYMCNNVCRSAIMYFSGYNLVSYCSYFLCTVTHRPVTCDLWNHLCLSSSNIRVPASAHWRSPSPPCVDGTAIPWFVSPLLTAALCSTNLFFRKRRRGY